MEGFDFEVECDFYSDGFFRVYDNTCMGSSIVIRGEAELVFFPSVFSVEVLRSRDDYRACCGLTVGDMFCGAGIGAVGTKKAGFITMWAFDNNPSAIDTFKRNISDSAFIADAKKINIESLADVDLITGGFPCQPFSVCGKGLGDKDPGKGNLGKIACDIIIKKMPKGFMLENVKGLIHKKNMDFFNSLIDHLGLHYNVSWECVDCSDYGVPQKRERVFIVGIRNDLGEKFEFPPKTHKDVKVNIKQALSGISLTPSSSHLNHSKSCGIRNDEKPFVHLVPVGGNWKDLDIEDQKTFMKGGFYSGGGRTGSLHKVNPDKPAKTILSSPMGKATAQILHWPGHEPRRYTVRESLRLQTVPDWFSFDDSIPLMKQYERCSGIPSLVSFIITSEIARVINLSKPTG